MVLHKVRRLLILGLVFLFAISLSSQAFAERARYKVKDFQQFAIEETEEHPAGLRLEISLDKPTDNFQVAVDPDNPNQLIVSLRQTKLTKVKKNIEFDCKVAEKIVFSPIDKANSEAVITTILPLNEKNYKYYTVPEDKKNKMPFRIVIELFEKGKDKRFVDLAGRRILIDAGHGGSDVGAVGPNGLREKDVNLDVSLKIQQILQNAGANVIMTRTTDRDVFGVNATAVEELQARVNVGKRNRPDIFVSVHSNSFSKPTANGTATYYYAKTPRDALLSQCIQNGIVEASGLYDRGIVEANFYVVKRSTMPAALIELAFISNYKEESLLASGEYRQTLAEGICKGLNDYFVKTQNRKGDKR